MAFWEKMYGVAALGCAVCVCLGALPVAWAEKNPQEISKLSKSIRANTSALTQLEEKLAAQEATLTELETELTKLQDHKTRREAALQNQVSAFHVHLRDTARMAAYPWQAQLLEDTLNGTPARGSVVKQLHHQQASAQATGREAIQETLTQQLALQTRYAQEAATTKELLAKRSRLQRIQWRLLKKLKVADSSLAKRLERALPGSRKITVEAPLNRTALHPTQPHAPVQGMVVEETTHDGKTGLTIMGTSGAPVMAFQQGKVIYSGQYRDFGQVLIIETAPNQHDVYAGLGHRSVRIGEHITKGQTLGSLPNEVEPRLYFERRS